MTRFRLLEVVGKFDTTPEMSPRDMFGVSPELRVMIRRAGVPLLWLPDEGVWIVNHGGKKTDQYLDFVSKRCYSYLLTTYLALKDTRLSEARCSQLVAVLRVLGQLAGKSDETITKDLVGPELNYETSVIKKLLEIWRGTEVVDAA